MLCHLLNYKFRHSVYTKSRRDRLIATVTTALIPIRKLYCYMLYILITIVGVLSKKIVHILKKA